MAYTVKKPKFGMENWPIIYGTAYGELLYEL
jgi:hypothetical protein